MLDELAVLHAEDIDTDVAIGTNETGPVSMDSDDVTVRDHAPESSRNVVAIAVDAKRKRHPFELFGRQQAQVGNQMNCVNRGDPLRPTFCQRAA